jgi:hypothetical protein
MARAYSLPPWSTPGSASLAILPGTLVVTFIVRLGDQVSALVLAPTRFLEGLRASCDLLGFAELQRDDERLEDLLPWAGNV